MYRIQWYYDGNKTPNTITAKGEIAMRCWICRKESTDGICPTCDLKLDRIDTTCGSCGNEVTEIKFDGEKITAICTECLWTVGEAK